MPDLEFRRAIASDLPAIVRLLADDQLGQQRDDAAIPLDPAYLDAFRLIDASPDQLLVVAVEGDAVVGTLQLSFIKGLARRGMLRGQIEAVRIAASRRGCGLGRRMMAWAIDACRARGCGLVQLTTDNSRSDAHRFYEQLGFLASHVGYKLAL